MKRKIKKPLSPFQNFIKRLDTTKIILSILLISILLLGSYLRHHNYRTYPRHGATFDEFAWTWLGINLIRTGVPMSWSPHGQYKQRDHLTYQGAAFWIVRPYLEHPPLFGLVAGGFTLLSGVEDMYDVEISNMRKGALILGVMTMIIVFAFTKALYGKTIGILAMLLYATVPTIAVGSRLLQNENFFIPVWLLSLLALYYYLQNKKNVFRNIAIILAALLPLAKVPWIVAALSLCFILFFHKKWKDIGLVLIVTTLFFSMFIAYGIYFDKELFLSLWKLQTARYDITFSGLFSIFLQPLLVDRFYLDGWILFGWFSLLFLARDWQKHLFILLPFTVYLFMYVFAIPDEPGHGWYRYPFYPFLLIAVAVFIKSELEKQTPARLLFLLFVGLSLLNLVWKQMFGFSLFVYRLFLILAFCSAFLPLYFRKSGRLSQVILLLWIGIFICGNIAAVILFNDL